MSIYVSFNPSAAMYRWDHFLFWHRWDRYIGDLPMPMDLVGIIHLHAALFEFSSEVKGLLLIGILRDP